MQPYHGWRAVTTLDIGIRTARNAESGGACDPDQGVRHRKRVRNCRIDSSRKADSPTVLTVTLPARPGLDIDVRPEPLEGDPTLVVLAQNFR